MWLHVIVALLLATSDVTLAKFRLEAGAYLKLPGADGCFAFNNGAADKATYDPQENLLYVIGHNQDVLHVVSLANPAAPQLLSTKVFNVATDGLPDSIKVDSFDPKAMSWNNECSTLMVVSEGDPHEINGVFEDPEADITLLIPSFGDTVDKTAQDLIDADIRQVFERCDSGSGSHVSSRVQDLEPKAVHLASNNVGYIIFQENNAIAALNLTVGANRELLFFNMNRKDFSISLKTRPGVQGLYQPNDMTSFEMNGKMYLVTADQGSIRRYQFGTCQFDESVDGVTWISENQFSNGLSSADQEALRTAMNDPAELGRLRFSKLRKATDGWNGFYGAYDFVTVFGGRSFSIVDVDARQRIYNSGDDFERYFETASDRHKSMYNAGVGPENVAQSSWQDRESPELGPAPSAIAVADWGGTKLVVIANGNVGGLYLYNVTSELTAGVQVAFEQYVRRGNSGQSWAEAYGNPPCISSQGPRIDNDIDDAAVGEPGISDLLYIEDNGVRMFVAVSRIAGSLSFYNLVQDT
ncbi:hypothetical protein BaRGS_00017369 [Batillaria attramentaria]|uniref:Choice-of-anchor I domain-containing protein n=1 Tax=Batillaria attramentaria TaxID=370345 RepID=A0ABD0KWH9_9CAEN